jgi:three-Cys-motif partner protein
MFRSHDQSEYIHAGSALRALRANPPFHRIVFIEKEKSNVAALQELIDKSDHRAARVIHGDANTVLRELCRSEDWRKQRGVIFLDPFGMSVDWPTLETIAATRALDVWFLFPLIGTIRNLPRLASALDAGKRLAVTRVLGTDEWFTKFYSPVEEGGMMLGSRAPAIVRRTATVDEIEAYVRARLRTIFPHVEVPVRLRAPRNKSLFSLFFAVSNPSAGAINLAVKGARHILAQA